MVRRNVFLSILTGSAIAALVGQAVAQSDEELPGKLVSNMHAAFGDHHARAIHAKGVVLEGTFKPTKAAHELSMAALFEQTVPVVVRFSDFTGIPDIPDGNPLASPRGFAVRFDPGQPDTMDIVSHGFNGFPVATSEEFGDLLQAIASSGPDATKPTKLDTFLDGHPIAKTFLTHQNPAPESYATNSYFGVNSFGFTNASGQKSIVRYRFIPKAGEHYLSAAAAAAAAPNFLIGEIENRVKSNPVAFDWFAQISGAGDKTEDPSIAWPEDRKLISLGTITISKMGADQKALDHDLMFLPGIVPEGIEIADPMLEVRDAAYPISFGQRQ